MLHILDENAITKMYMHVAVDNFRYKIILINRPPLAVLEPF